MRFLALLCLLTATNAAPRSLRQTQFAHQLPLGFRPAKQILTNEDASSVKVDKDEIVAVPQPQVELARQQAETLVVSQNTDIPAVPSLENVIRENTPSPAPAPPVDKNVDLDGDGALSLAEVQYAAFVHHGLSSSVVEELFKEVDKNKDGYLTSLEFNDIRPLVLAKAESAAMRYLQIVDTDKNGLLSLKEAQAYILTEYGIGNKDVERVWRLVMPNGNDEMDAVMFSKLRRRIRGMSIRLARQIMKVADKNEDGHIDAKEAQQVAFEQEGLGVPEVHDMITSVDDNNDGELNAPEFADFEKILRAKGVDIARRALKVVDKDGSGYLTMDEAKRIAFEHYGFDEKTLSPFFGQADENEDGQLDAVEFAGFRSVIRSKAVKNAVVAMQDMDTDGDGMISGSEAVSMARKQDDMDAKETYNLFNLADQDKSGKLDKVELADFLRLVRLNAIKFATDHFREFDVNKDKMVTVDELESSIEHKYNVDPKITKQFFEKVDIDGSGDLSPGEIVDFRHEIRRYVAERDSQQELAKMKQDELEERLDSGKGDQISNRNAGTDKEEVNKPSQPTGAIIKPEERVNNADLEELQKQEEIARRRQLMLQRTEKDEKEGGDFAELKPEVSQNDGDQSGTNADTPISGESVKADGTATKDPSQAEVELTPDVQGLSSEPLEAKSEGIAQAKQPNEEVVSEGNKDVEDASKAVINEIKTITEDGQSQLEGEQLGAKKVNDAENLGTFEVAETTPSTFKASENLYDETVSETTADFAQSATVSEDFHDATIAHPSSPSVSISDENVATEQQNSADMVSNDKEVTNQNTSPEIDASRNGEEGQQSEASKANSSEAVTEERPTSKPESRRRFNRRYV